jgi:uncharacterized protein YciI
MMGHLEAVDTGGAMRHTFTVVPAQIGLMILAAIAGVQIAQAGAPAAVAEAAPSPAAGKLQQFLYVLRLAPRLYDDGAWTDADNAAVSRHFEHLKQAAARGRVILAGRTTEPGDKTFGLVIFEAADEGEARHFMESDPAVVAGVMTATLHPYAVALQRKN